MWTENVLSQACFTSGVADRPRRWSRSESCVARAGCPPPDGRESRDSGGAPRVRLPTSWERVSSRRSARLRLRPVRHTPVGAVPYPGLPCPVEFRCGEGEMALRPQPGGVWTHSSATNRRESRGQPKDRNSEGGPYAAGPDARRSLSKRSGRRCCAETGCRVPTCGAATRGRGSLPSLVYRAVYGR